MLMPGVSQCLPRISSWQARKHSAHLLKQLLAIMNEEVHTQDCLQTDGRVHPTFNFTERVGGGGGGGLSIIIEITTQV